MFKVPPHQMLATRKCKSKSKIGTVVYYQNRKTKERKKKQNWCKMVMTIKCEHTYTLAKLEILSLKTEEEPHFWKTTTVFC